VLAPPRKTRPKKRKKRARLVHSAPDLGASTLWPWIGKGGLDKRESSTVDGKRRPVMKGDRAEALSRPKEQSQQSIKDLGRRAASRPCRGSREKTNFTTLIAGTEGRKGRIRAQAHPGRGKAGPETKNIQSHLLSSPPFFPLRMIPKRERLSMGHGTPSQANPVKSRRLSENGRQKFREHYASTRPDWVSAKREGQEPRIQKKEIPSLQLSRTRRPLSTPEGGRIRGPPSPERSTITYTVWEIRSNLEKKTPRHSARKIGLLRHPRRFPRHGQKRRMAIAA